MATEFRLPDLGENIESGDVVNVLVNEGDEIQPEQNIVEIETDKATVEVPCPFGGRVAKIHVKPGDTVEIGGLLITVDSGDGKSSGSSSKAKPAEKSKPAPEKAKPARKPEPVEDEVDESDDFAEEELEADEEEEEAPAKPALARASREEAKKADRPAKPAKPAAKLPVDEDEEEEDDPAPPKKPAASPKKKVEVVAEEEDEEEEAPKPAAKSSNGAARSQPPVSMPSRGESAETAAGPATRRLARELGVDLHRIKGTGPGGRITRDDVVNVVRGAPAAASAPAPTAPAAGKANAPRAPQTPPGVESEDAFGKTRREKFSRIRKTIATNMSRSASTIPHVTNFDEADITELDEIRKESAADYQGVSIKLTMMPFIMKSVAHALKLHPLLNAQIDTEADEIVYKDYVNLGIAVDTPRGLVVPVVKGVDQMTIPQIAHAMSKVSENARTNQFALEDLRGGSFTISNLGAVGGIYSTPIINHPEVAILLVGRSRKLPVVINDEVKIRLMMPLSLSYDHRLIDGATAARFLNEVISLLHAPGRLLLSPLAG